MKCLCCNMFFSHFVSSRFIQRVSIKFQSALWKGLSKLLKLAGCKEYFQSKSRGMINFKLHCMNDFRELLVNSFPYLRFKEIFQCLMPDVVPDPANSKWAKECTKDKVKM